MNGWYVFYQWLGLGILWMLALTFSFYLYVVMRGHEKVLNKLYVATVWATFMLTISIVTSIALGGL